MQMVCQAQSGHPGGSLSSIDFLSTLYLSRLIQSNEPLIVSNGHISPAIYALLGNLGVYDMQEVIRKFRRDSSIFEGHVTRHVKGVPFGTGPLGVGFSAAAGFALAQKLKDSKQKVFVTIGDGESQEGQVYETMHAIAKHNLNNLVIFMDYNKVQLTASLKDTMPINPKAHFKAAGFVVLEINGHNFKAIYKAIAKALNSKKPVLIMAKTIMGHGSQFMEPEGKKFKSTWHGKAPKMQDIQADLERLQLSPKEEALLSDCLQKHNKLKNLLKAPVFHKLLSPNPKVKVGKIRQYTAEDLTDNRSAYGNALLDLAKANRSVVALTADLEGSVKTNILKNKYPDRHLEVGIAEQAMVSISGGLSLQGIIPFCSTFGAFMSSRAKDQARVNDINQTNVKMVATHCGLSVGEDGPTHQALDDVGSFLGFFNTAIIEPGDPNQTDRVIRFVAAHHGNFYVRMGRHKYQVILDEKGQAFYGPKYRYKYGVADQIRSGQDIIVVSSGATLKQAVEAADQLRSKNIQLGVWNVSSPKQIDKKLLQEIQKVKKLIVVQDHNPYSGLASQLEQALFQQGISVSAYANLAVKKYQLSDTYDKLYKKAKIDTQAIVQACQKLLK